MATGGDGDTSKQELFQLIKRFGAYVTFKISNLFPLSLHNLDLRSIGAVAGLAVAIVFTWRLLRSPSGSQRRQQKRQGPSSSNPGVGTNSNSNASVVPSDACSPSDDSRAQNVVDEFFQPVKPTLGQIVRQKLSEGRKVTCRLLGVILEESSPEELQKQATVRSSVLEVLLEVTKFCDLYLMERVLDDESEKRVLVALEEAGVFTSGGLVKDKVLFCSTENGRSSFVRQLEPDWHIDSNPEIVTQLAVCFYISQFHPSIQIHALIQYSYIVTVVVVEAIRSLCFICSSNDLTTDHIAEVYQVSTSCISLQN
ncbi:Peroxisome biogenesis protein 22 isoform B [Glycine soja]|uniref:Peroxisome biogenesis protein 22 isoform B n=1 Tax=Glycine soja TaxID=3848 RepID=A0A445IC72_GLYSO|nr:Peroxisome biogenesis protein 22 isoform B [Glycine soja]